MSAREKLIRLARENTPDYGNHVPCDPETVFMFIGQDEYIAHVRKLLDEHAHELAEQQRVYAEEEWTGSDARMILRRRVAWHLANLIDPNAGPVRPDEEPT